MSLGLDPVTASLLGTLLQGQVSTPEEAAAQADTQALHAQVQQAQNAAGAAQQNYQQAAQTPAPSLTGADTLLPTLVGHIASVIARDPSYVKRAEENIQGQQAVLLKNRADSLQAQHDIYEQRAKAAERAGDLELAGKAREQLAKTQGLIKQILDAQSQAAAQHRTETSAGATTTAATTRAGATVRAAEIAANAAGGGATAPGAPSPFESEVITTPGGQKALEVTKFTGKQRLAATQFALANKIPLADAAEASQLRDIQSARLSIDTIFAKIRSILPHDALARAQATPGIKMSELLQTNEQRAAYKSLWGTAIRLLRAQAGSKSFRMTNAEIDRAVRSDIPVLNDTYGTMIEKLQNASDLLDNAEAPITTRDWRGASSFRNRSQSAATDSGTTTPPTYVLMLSPEGKRREVPAGDAVKQATAHGWKRASR